jgi:ketosteroid isomerase-like protein
MSTAIAETTGAVLVNHIQALATRDLDLIVSDYSEDAVVFSPQGAFQGHANIRAFFGAALGMLTPEAMGNLKVSKQEINGEYAYVLWSALPVIAYAGDTFQVHDGKIVLQSFVPAP